MDWETSQDHLLIGAAWQAGDENFLLFDAGGSRYESYYDHCAKQQHNRDAGVEFTYDAYPELNPTEPALIEAQIRELEGRSLGANSIIGA